MTRVARRYVLASVAREPLPRVANLARGRYVGSLGNTSGHRTHWSNRSFLSLVGRYGRVEAVRSRFP